MNYVIAGYSIVLGILFLYTVQLVWRRHRLNRMVALTRADRAANQATRADPVANQAAQGDP